MSKWYASCIILRLEREREPKNWKNLHVGGMHGISCQHFQAMVTNLLQKTLGMAGRTESRVETWYGGETNNVLGKLEYQDGFR